MSSRPKEGASAARSGLTFEHRYSAAGDEGRAEFLSQELLLLREANAREGIEPPEIQDWMDQLAGAFELDGRYEEAIDLRTQLFEFAQKYAGVEHDATVAHEENLAHDLFWANRLDASIFHFERILAARQRHLGHRDPLTLGTQGYLAAVLVRDAQFERAITLEADLVDYFEMEFGSNDDRTIEAKRELATTIRWQKDQA
jgi:hypothetical protein